MPGKGVLCTRLLRLSGAGGGENQLVQTGRHLEELGVPVRLFSAWTDRLEAARLLHLFGMSREGIELARVAKARAVPVVLSPICWYEPRAMAALEPDPFRKLSSLAGWGLPLDRARNPELAARAVAAGRRRSCPIRNPRRRNLCGSSVSLASGSAIVPNGVLPSFGAASPELFHRRDGPYTVCAVGRQNRAAEEHPAV